MLPNSWGPATVLTVALTLIVTIVGAVIAIWHPSELSFTSYADLLLGGAGANSLLAIGRGLFAPKTATTTTAVGTPPPADAAGKVVVTSA